MIPHPDDTIVAIASSRQLGDRAILRLSGAQIYSLIPLVFSAKESSLPYCREEVIRRFLIPGEVSFSGTQSKLSADLYLWPAPHSYTGQDVAEIHLLNCPPLVDDLVAQLLQLGARAAQAGEFTMRAFLAGKRDLTRAEAVIAVIEASSRDELQQALLQLAGGVAQPLQGLRDDLLNLLADVEAGLDFTEEDIEFVGKREMLLRVSKGMAEVTNLARQLNNRSVSDRTFRVALVGEPNAGKSSLFNALAGIPAAIVSAKAGTTRDYLTRSITLGDGNIELIDTAGWQLAHNTIEEKSQRLGKEKAQSADLVLWCQEVTHSAGAKSNQEPITVWQDVPVLVIWTKCDQGLVAPEGIIATSAKSLFGIEKLKKAIRTKAQSHRQPALAPSLSRCKHHVESCLEHLRKAHSIILFDDPAELLALELRLALDQLGEMVGAIYTDDLLDRIFSRFCIGK